jgi:phosphonate transport system substrate-binding protein
MYKRSIGAWLAFWLLSTGNVVAAEPAVLHFGVINQRSLALTAEYWNPILEYVSARSGMNLRLKMAKTTPETTAQSVKGEHDFVYSNHLFMPERNRIGFRVIARFDTPPAHGSGR